MVGNNYEYFRNQFIKNPLLALRFFMNKLTGTKKIIFNHFSRPFTVAAYKQADLFFFPSNIECSPIVLFECAASKLPFLSTDVGNSIEIAAWTLGGEILATTKDDKGFSHAEIEKATAQLNNMMADEGKRKKWQKLLMLFGKKNTVGKLLRVNMKKCIWSCLAEICTISQINVIK